MEKVEQKNAWKPTTADGIDRRVVHHARVADQVQGPVEYRATVGGKKVAYTTLRSSYLHEADSIIGFQMLNDPDFVKGPRTSSARRSINYTFNWFYADSQHTAYYNSGDNPVRASGVDAGVPGVGAAGVRGGGTGTRPAAPPTTPRPPPPHSVDQDYYISWNNKQAEEYDRAPGATARCTAATCWTIG